MCRKRSDKRSRNAVTKRNLRRSTAKPSKASRRLRSSKGRDLLLSLPVYFRTETQVLAGCSSCITGWVNGIDWRTFKVLPSRKQSCYDGSNNLKGVKEKPRAMNNSTHTHSVRCHPRLISFVEIQIESHIMTFRFGDIHSDIPLLQYFNTNPAYNSGASCLRCFHFKEPRILTAYSSIHPWPGSALKQCFKGVPELIVSRRAHDGKNGLPEGV